MSVRLYSSWGRSLVLTGTMGLVHMHEVILQLGAGRSLVLTGTRGLVHMHEAILQLGA